MATTKWTRRGRVTVAGSGLTLLALGVLPAGCAGDEFASCEGSECSDAGSGGSAGADGDVTTSTGTGGASGSDGSTTTPTASGGSGGSGGSEGSGGSTSDGSGGSGGSRGSGASDAGGSSSSSTDGGEAGDSGTVGEGGAGATDPTDSCEDTCDGTCCDGVCVDLESDIDHCGACGAACTLTEAEEACVAGACVVTQCRDQSVDCNGEASDGCEADLLGFPAVPGLTRPMLGAFTGSLHARDATGSLRPEFAWTEVEPMTCDAVTYHVQVDDECSFSGFSDCEFPSPELDITGVATATFTPEADLPVEEEQAPLGRRYYWRVRACEGTVVCSEWSEVFYVDVGRMREDVTGDGYADIVGATEDLELFIVRGSEDIGEVGEAEIIPTTQTPLHPEAPQFSFLGDVDGDGFNDVGGAGIVPSRDAQAVYVWTGGEVFGALPGVLVGSGLPNPGDPPGAWPAGDDNADGYADFMLLRRFNEEPVASPTLKFGALTLADSPDDELRLSGMTFLPPPEVDGVVRVATNGDFNGDGYPDQAIDSESSQHGVIFMLGGPEPSQHPFFLFPSDEVCSPILATLDFNGDSIDDLAAMCRNGSRFAVVFGRHDLNPGTVEVWSADRKTEFGDLAAGDIDGSGFDDLITSDGTTFWGAAEPDDDPEDVLVTSSAYEPMVVGDHNGDGAIDLVRAHHWYSGFVTAETPDLEFETDEGESFIVIALAH